MEPTHYMRINTTWYSFQSIVRIYSLISIREYTGTVCMILFTLKHRVYDCIRGK